jgi:hypothetical protein
VGDRTVVTGVMREPDEMEQEEESTETIESRIELAEFEVGLQCWEDCWAW